MSEAARPLVIGVLPFGVALDGGAYRVAKDPTTRDWNYGRPGNTGYRSRVRRGIEKPKRARKAQKEKQA